MRKAVANDRLARRQDDLLIECGRVAVRRYGFRVLYRYRIQTPVGLDTGDRSGNVRTNSSLSLATYRSATFNFTATVVTWGSFLKSVVFKLSAGCSADVLIVSMSLELAYRWLLVILTEKRAWLPTPSSVKGSASLGGRDLLFIVFKRLMKAPASTFTPTNVHRSCMNSNTLLCFLRSGQRFPAGRLSVAVALLFRLLDRLIRSVAYRRVARFAQAGLSFFGALTVRA